MSTVTTITDYEPAKCEAEIKAGDWFRDNDDNDLLVLARVGKDQYCLISASTGARYAEPALDISETGVLDSCMQRVSEVHITYKL